MKRDLPATRCTECGAAGYNARVANARCCKIIDKQRCNGTNALATKPSDWTECTQCEATGYYRNKDCPSCSGSGYLFVAPQDEVAV